MTVTAGGYILVAPLHRRAELLWARDIDGRLAEPVARFAHSPRAPLVVFASFEDGLITHIADGRKGMPAGTGLVRLNMTHVHELADPIPFDALISGFTPRLRSHLRRIASSGGLLPPKTLGAFVDQVLAMDASIRPRLARYSERRKSAIARYRPRERENLALQKDALGLALDLCGLARDDLLEWEPVEDQKQSFLDGLPTAVVREDVMLLSDYSRIPGFLALREATHAGYKVFENERDASVRMTVIMANRLPLEQQTGADLIYFNEAYRSFAMVQYKAMEKGTDQHEFRWTTGDQFCEEIARMEAIVAQLKAIPPSADPDGFRFSDNPFFLKFCPRVVFNPDDAGLFKGIYLPLDLLKRGETAGRFKGVRGGNVITYENVGRRINNTDFVALIANSWVGTSVEQSAILEALIRNVLTAGKTITMAIKHSDGAAER
ncbi:MAG: hypothetical protein NW217_00290 [Hyphomicrobiaceae bacterium]|nr:hypothetical protein [Hyphomicrobiaceae bacterium]